MMTKTITMKYFLAMVLFCVLCGSSCAYFGHNTSEDIMDVMMKRYQAWIIQHGRRYENRDEWNLRFGIYQSNVVLIDLINSQNLPYRLTDNEFADMTNLEFKSRYLGYRSRGQRQAEDQHNCTFGDSSVPSSIDWRKFGAVTPIKNQGTCGSCWAFSAVASVEGINKIKTGKLVSLSEQELVDCDYKGENEGCNGGYMEKAFEFIKNNNGITTEKNYPYEGLRGRCKIDKEKQRAVVISGYVSVPPKNEKALQAAVAKQPVAVAVDAGGYEFQLYSSGILSGYCGKDLNHGVAAVGYGVENGEKYWLVKNSWGTKWGEEGYVKIKRDSSDKNGECGIALEPSYPTKS
ncbi:cysteine proteinase COT44-like [Primulina tabacum]|uniref:cysteine proteinase COT44-like n=1 Tax=Primulina tabacum TaxID=48773 RepID=UPI003F593146